ncbi:MAG: LapA family protein [Opitutaceae bacterium]
MKLSWLFVILLLIFVAVFSVQNAGVITVHFLSWQIQISAALVIQLAALLGGLVGLAFGAWSRRTPRPVEKTAAAPAPNVTPARPAPPAASSAVSSPTPGSSNASTSAGGTRIGPSPAERIEKKSGPS